MSLSNTVCLAFDSNILEDRESWKALPNRLHISVCMTERQGEGGGRDVGRRNMKLEKRRRRR